MQRSTVTIHAPYNYTTHPHRGGPQHVHVEGLIRITMRVLEGEELGTLKSGAEVQTLLLAATAKINSENIVAYKRGTRQLRIEAEQQYYYRSPPHQAWASAAQLRTANRIHREWWLDNDPFGGTAGNGPNIIAEGRYPGFAAKIAMAHDTDWTLGRQFNAGPLKGLYTSTASPGDMGMYGLNPFSSIKPGTHLYDVPSGHPDWQVSFDRISETRS